MKNLFQGVYQGTKVLVTGHTGFKGSWLCLWLKALGAELTGFSLDPPSDPYHFDLLKLEMNHVIGDLRHEEDLQKVFDQAKPEMVFHLAAQPLVRRSYRNPAETFDTNVMGTVNLLEAVRNTASVKAVVNVTSDKCYDNKEWVWGYRENDPMGGHDPYSCSKGCAELVTQSYQRSFFHGEGASRALLASARSGNVIGGGDWGGDRLIPDVIRAVSKNETTHIRSPRAIRPWQHVLDPLSGYLMLGWRLLTGERKTAEAWNFGPTNPEAITVLSLVQRMNELWQAVKFKVDQDPNAPHEVTFLKLDCTKAHHLLGWQSVWTQAQAISQTCRWYQSYLEEGKVISAEQLKTYVEAAREQKLPWVM
ncbi:CDP-glucose 4,6-dehydratase [Dethiosulfatarculus sandiegensis]|uniref:CDP-glucose 4,6-dehydratase n=1 Tax=Dethiosulfatarculus sandiegensis TaxID=1429043 RepID=A0A0D2HJR3_9BACT|nr:CDP-glucose 4,6-dehydratase [Dethiosulfatarculus sandiegensis]KIX10893.1 CDP-glucose 4,6-dehydratase [Dethiosulfatarculus sandiegensis]